MGKYVGGLVIILILGAIGYYGWIYFHESGTSTTPPDNSTPPAQQEEMSTYSTSTFSIQYPSNYSVDAAYAYQGVPKKPIPGVKFVIPGSMATGTNLSGFDTGVSVESLPRAQRCTGDIYIYDPVKANDMTIGSTTFSVATTSGAGAGNFYEEHVFAVKDSKPCTAVRYFIHSTNINNYPANTVREYDRDALLSDFDKIRDSLQLN